MLERTIAIAEQALHLAAESAPYLLLGFLLAGLLHEFVPNDWITRRLGGERIRAVFLAALAGLPLPLCSCAVVPTADALHRKGAGRGPTLAFLISTPETSVESIALTWGLFGGPMAILRPVAALLTAVAAGLAALALGRKSSDSSVVPPHPTDGDACRHASHAHTGCAEHPAASPSGAIGCAAGTAGSNDSPSLRTRLGRALRFAFGPSFDDLFPSIAFGLVTAAAVAALLPDDWIPRAADGTSGLLLLLLVALVSAPLYLCASAATPLAAALVVKGLSPGAALVLLLVGPATNLATIGLVARRFGRGAVVLTLGGVIGMAVGIGMAVDALGWISITETLREHMIEGHSESLPALESIALFVCSVLCARSLQRRWMPGRSSGASPGTRTSALAMPVVPGRIGRNPAPPQETLLDASHALRPGHGRSCR